MIKRVVFINFVGLISLGSIAFASSPVEINFGAINSLPKTVVKKEIAPKKPSIEINTPKLMPKIKKTIVAKKRPVVATQLKSLPKVIEPAIIKARISNIDRTISMMEPIDDIAPVVKKTPKQAIKAIAPVTKIISNKPKLTDRIKLGFGKTISSISGIIPGNRKKEVAEVKVKDIKPTILSDNKRALSPPPNMKITPKVEKAVIINQPYVIDGNKKQVISQKKLAMTAEAPAPKVLATPILPKQKTEKALKPIYDDNSYMPALPVTPVKEKFIPENKIAKIQNASISSNQPDFILSFTNSSSELSAENRSILTKAIQKLKSDTSKMIKVTSYASNHNKAAEDGKKISLARALSVRSYLMDSGVKPNNIDVQAFGTDDIKNGNDRIYLLIN